MCVRVCADKMYKWRIDVDGILMLYFTTTTPTTGYNTITTNTNTETTVCGSLSMRRR